MARNIAKLLLLPGDGIGPEVMAEVERVIDWLGGSAGRALRDRRAPWWEAAALDAHGSPLTDATLAEGAGRRRRAVRRRRRAEMGQASPST